MQKPKETQYAHMKVVVTVLVVTFFSFLAVIRHHEVRSGRNSAEMKPNSLPDLF